MYKYISKFSLYHNISFMELKYKFQYSRLLKPMSNFTRTNEI